LAFLAPVLLYRRTRSRYSRNGVPGFLLGRPVEAVVVGGSTASNPQAQLGLAGSNNGSNLTIARNLYTFEDRVSLTRGRHQIDFGVGSSASNPTKPLR